MREVTAAALLAGQEQRPHTTNSHFEGRRGRTFPPWSRRFGQALLLMALLPTVSMAQCILEGKRSTFRQPDGTVIELAFFGGEAYTRTETVDGYTVVFDAKKKAYFYAELAKDGASFRSTGILVGGAAKKKAALQKGLRLNPEARRAKAAARLKQLEEIRQDGPKRDAVRQQVKAYREHQQLFRSAPFQKSVIDQKSGTGGGSKPVVRAPPSNPPTLGDLIGLTILVDFSDEPARTDITQADIDDYCNKPGGNWSNNGSVYDYFYVQSNGRLRYNNNVTYYVRVPKTKSYYNDTSLGSGACGRRLLADAVAVLIADGYDFSGLTTDGAGDVIACNLFWAGNDSGVWAQGLWPHRSSISQIDVGGGIYIHDYQMTDLGASGNPTIGTFCHENGHLVGKYRDYYDYGGESRGLSAHCLMASGNYYSTVNPANVSGYLKYHSGWLDIVELTTLPPPFA